MTKQFLFILFLGGFFIGSVAQNNCDCKKDIEDFSFINQLLDLKEYKQAATELKKVKTTDINCKIEYLQLQAQFYSLQIRFHEADSCLTELKTLVKKTTCKKAEAGYYLQRGTLLMKKSLYDSALTCLIRAHELAVESKDSIGQFNALFSIGGLFNIMRQSDKAIDYDRKAFALAKQLKNHQKEVRALSNMQAHFGVWYDITEEMRFIDSIKKITRNTLELAKKYNLRIDIAQTYSVLSGVAYVEGNYKKQLMYADSALMFLNRQSDFRFIMSVFQKKCDAYIEQKNYRLARSCADSCLKFALLENNPLSSAISFERLYEVEKLSGNPGKALIYHERFTKIRDSIRTMDRTKVINELEQKYNKAENEKEINKLNYEKKDLNQQKEIDQLQIRSLIGIVAAIVLLLIVIVFFYRQSVIKSKLQKMNIEQRLNRARINPHFFFNALASIQTLASESVNAQKVVILISKFSKIMRQSLESTYHELVSIEEEMSFLQNYLDLQKMRYPEKFDYRFNVSDEIDPSELRMPGMIIQPFIENSIEHGLKNIDYKGLITVSFIKEPGFLRISVQDNGSGFKESENYKTYPSRATQIVKDRLFLLNKQYKSDARFEINSSGTSGTCVIVYLPLLY